MVSRTTGGEALQLLKRFVDRCHPDSLEWNPPRMLEHMSSQGDVEYSPLTYGYSNFARPGFRQHLVRFGPPPAWHHDNPSGGTLGEAGLAVSAKSSNVDEALRYAAFVADGAVQRSLYFDGGGQPGHRSAWTDPRVNAAASGFFRDTLRTVEAAYVRPRHDGFLQLQDAGGELIHGFLREGGDPDDVLDGLGRAYRSSLEPSRGRV